MKKRVLSTLGLWVVIILGLFILGPQAGVWTVAAAVFCTQLELYRLLAKIGYKPLQSLGLGAGVSIVVGAYYLPQIAPFLSGQAGIFLTLLSFIGCSCGVLAARVKNPLDSLLTTLFGIIYVPFTLQFLVTLLEVAPNAKAGIFLALWLLVVVKFTDVGGLLIGSKLGACKLAPHISPAKTWEGVVGGIVVASALGTVFSQTFASFFPVGFQGWRAALMALPIAAVSVLSDLLESLIKRRAKVKDSGSLIPGIGGVFDLTDSLILSVPLGYYMILYTLI